MKAEDQSPAIVSDHAFRNMENPFGLCQLRGCNLARAAHEDPGMPPLEEHLATTYRCPDCVHTGTSPCPHGRPTEDA
jgi:hypothetical protein